MSDFNSFVKDQLMRKEVAREYYRLAPFFRLADQLILLRKKRGLTQQELAVKAQTTQAVGPRLENATVHCSLESVIRLAEALDAAVEVKLVPVEELHPEETIAGEEDASESSAPCADKDDALKGIVYFNQGAQKPCPNLLWPSFDPLTKQVISPQQQRKQKVREIA